ncbi:MAG: SBBP repeat-containing protein [Thermoguttaceae bacterium]|jgi:hypothetical protein
MRLFATRSSKYRHAKQANRLAWGTKRLRLELLEDRRLLAGPEIQWMTQFGFSAPADDFGSAVAANGNVYVTGSTLGSLDGTNAGATDVFVRKYDSNGVVLWTRQFGTAKDDGATGIAVDLSENIYVVGSTRGNFPGFPNGGGSDAFVRKYDANGAALWTRQFGSYYGDDYALGLAVDYSDNVYVVGQTPGANTAPPEAFVRKYDANGELGWTRPFGTPKTDCARGIAVGSDGAIFVAGETEGSLVGTNAGGYDPFVRKYNADGTVAWTSQFGTTHHDYVTGISADSSGNACLTGYTDLGHGFPSVDLHAFVCRYSADGTELWTREFSTTASSVTKGIATDSSGNIYVAGYTYDSLAGTNAGYEDAFVRTYNADGAELWTRQFGTASFDRATGVSVDSCGDVYLTGNTGGVYTRGADAFVRKYAANGDELWATQFGGFRLIPDHSAAICSSGDIIYAAGYDWTGSAFVSKYDVDGTALWTEQFGTGSTNATGIATDSSGNVYVAGYTASDLGGTNAGGSDAFVRKYDENGDVVWTNQSGTTYAERTSGICVDSNGNIYVAGTTIYDPYTGATDAFVSKYQADGTLVWTKQTGTAAGHWASGVCVDSSGNIYMSGYTAGNLDGMNAGGDDAFVRKYDTYGEVIWTEQFGSTGWDRATGVSVDSSDAIYLSGYTTGALDGTKSGGSDAFVRKYDASGTALWSRQFGTTADDCVTGISVDFTGIIYVAGYTYDALDGTNAGGSDAFVRKYDASGTALWSKQFGTTVDDAARAITVDSSGYIYVTGDTGVTEDIGGGVVVPNTDVFLTRISPYTVDMTGPSEVFRGDNVAFTFEATGPSQGPFTYQIDWNGDSVIEETSSSPTVNHVFSQAGTHAVKVTVVDEATGRRIGVATQSVVVKIPVQIDVKLAENVDSLNLASNGLIVVTMYSTSEFDTRAVNVNTVIFAGAGVANSVYQDADGDGDLDLVMHFQTQATNLQAMYTDLLLDDSNTDGILDSTKQLAEITLVGETQDNLTLEGSDSLNIFLSGKKLRELLDQLHAVGAL